MSKTKTIKLKLKKRVNNKPWFPVDGSCFFPTTLTYGLPKDKKNNAIKLIIHTGKKNEFLKDSELSNIDLTFRPPKKKVVEKIWVPLHECRVLKTKPKKIDFEIPIDYSFHFNESLFPLNRWIYFV